MTEVEDIYANGGFPFIKICIKDDAMAIEEKTKREFNSKNVMSIQTILEKRRAAPFLSLEQKRSISIESSGSDSNIKFNRKYDINKSLRDISNLDVNELMKQSRPKSKKRTNSKKRKSK